MRLIIFLLFICTTAIGQTLLDSSKILHLAPVEITALIKQNKIDKLPDIHNTYIVGGVKSEVVSLTNLPSNVADKIGRQLFAKVPGAFIYDMDGSGNQINFSLRGLDPHRSWEMNIRQNDVMINSDLYGYPASHYSPPLESIEKIEILRGTAALQYGSAFGGMVNYVTKTGTPNKPLSIESINTVGSFGALSSYNAIGGSTKKFSYYAYNSNRTSEGYRENSSSSSQAQFLQLKYQINSDLSLKFEIGRNVYRYKIPGPLTDSTFYENPKQSTRNRNYYSPAITIPSMTLNWKIRSNTQLNWIVSGVFGSRNSVEFEGFANKADLPDPLTEKFANRAVNIDMFNSRTTELRMLNQYRIGKFKNVLSTSIRYFNNDMTRKQRGIGTNGSDYDLTVQPVNGFSFGRDMKYKSQSIAIAIENLIHINSKFTIAPGIRYENGYTNFSGYISYLDAEDIPNQIKHNIPVFGINTQYQINNHHRLYAAFSQAYRPVLFKDIIPASNLQKANKNLKNATGFNFEVGMNGYLHRRLKYELTYFTMLYNNRMGDLLQTDENNQTYIYKTNIGNSITHGLETFLEYEILQSKKTTISVFTSTSIMKAQYQNANLALKGINGSNTDISGNEVESLPRFISRNGIEFQYLNFSSNLQFSYTSSSFSDPGNTLSASENGSIGLVPSYGVFDINFRIPFAKYLTLNFGINNLTDNSYFTKRPLIYPGPGIWPSDGRSFYITIKINL